MAKTWSADNPKAALMTRKRAAIVGAAREAFLRTGYAEASVNHIAAAAGVSIKTLYRHFDSKDDLFSAVMQAACDGPPTAEPLDKADEPPPAWYVSPPGVALALAGQEYLHHVLSAEQIDLYRVVTRDAARFPEVGRRYQAEVVGSREAIFAGYLDLWIAREGWTVRDPAAAAQTFAGLLKAGVYEERLLGLAAPDDTDIIARAASAASRMLILLAAGQF